MKKFETPLCEIAYKYSTDKCPQLFHTYTPFYYELLKDKRNSFKKILEIGVGCSDVMPRRYKNYITGASLYMWRDFFPNAQIYGADILPETMFEADRIKTYICDQTKKEDLINLITQIGADIDLVVDDGLHERHTQIDTCRTLMSLLKKDVIYIIEDIKYINHYARYLKGYNCQLVPSVSGKNMDNIIVVRNKGENGI